MMDTHGPVVSVVPTSLYSLLLLLKKKIGAQTRPIVSNCHLHVDILTLSYRGTTKLTIPLHP